MRETLAKHLKLEHHCSSTSSLSCNVFDYVWNEKSQVFLSFFLSFRGWGFTSSSLPSFLCSSSSSSSSSSMAWRWILSFQFLFSHYSKRVLNVSSSRHFLCNGLSCFCQSEGNFLGGCLSLFPTHLSPSLFVLLSCLLFCFGNALLLV